MPLFISRSSPRPRRAVRLRFDQRPAVRIGAAAAGAGLVVAAVAGSMLQSSFAEDLESPAPVTASPAPVSRATPTSSPVVTPRATPTPRTSSFQTCEEVREAGADPLRRGEPGYGPHLDRNGNGLACEPF
jgi:hypothetical protein